MVGVLSFHFLQHDAIDTLLNVNDTSGLALQEAFDAWRCFRKVRHGRKGIFTLELRFEK